MNPIIIQVVAIIAIFYFFIILPGQRRVKKEKAFESGLKVGDKIITKAGIHGKIAELSETTVVVETMAGKIKMEKSAISLEMSAKLTEKEKK
ncbi:MAG: preprotein translocase subunit YajC [Flavobacterium sp.]|uniref:preprotein translocase subunit YajC n=1 Tax=Flavobacterium sp. TaxID=239 RepID=UPI000C65E3DA|nr:preprotein translocase subunit YajC [Flavobacterium sp.]MBF01784.1 preprotein translocase subunit YajC [Flavobacterium sp.]|tara:strand:- start:373 stop:648 length:276 start_codon:yes stop_codon:yes gene_type:complete